MILNTLWTVVNKPRLKNPTNPPQAVLQPNPCGASPEEPLRTPGGKVRELFEHKQLRPSSLLLGIKPISS